MLTGVLLLTFSLFHFNSVTAQTLTPAFPGAEGAGKYTSGGRGGIVVKVTNLNDEGPGSLRKAIRKKGARIIVFDISGTIELKSSLDINRGDLTIAGQTAPGMGICLKGYGLKVSANNVIIRYLRVRPGDIAGIELDALTCKKSKNVIIDHCSFSWATDEVCSIYDNENTTLQYCIISESLNSSVHHKGDHGYGGIWGGMQASFHHNLFIHNNSRNPRLQGSRYHKMPEKENAEIVNNVIYNWKSKAMYAGEDGNYNIVGNYFIPGPATKGSKRKYFLEPYLPLSNYYIHQNIIERGCDESIGSHNGILFKNENDYNSERFVKQSIKVSDYVVVKAKVALKEVLKSAGASLSRDCVDERLIKETKKGMTHFGKAGIINTQNEVGGWPDLPVISGQPDSDKDGMPDKWEIKKGLNPDNSDDAIKYTLDKFYTNIEVYLNSLLK